MRGSDQGQHRGSWISLDAAAVAKASGLDLVLAILLLLLKLGGLADCTILSPHPGHTKFPQSPAFSMQPRSTCTRYLARTKLISAWSPGLRSLSCEAFAGLLHGKMRS